MEKYLEMKILAEEMIELRQPAVRRNFKMNQEKSVHKLRLKRKDR